MPAKHRFEPARRHRLGAAALALATATGAAVIATTDASASPKFAVRLDAGAATSYRAPSGTLWRADADFAGGQEHAAGAVPIAGTHADRIFRTHRWGMTGYRIPVSCSGTYRVKMRFAETTIGRAGGRVFGVSAEGVTKLRRLDVFAAAGGLNHAVTRSFEVAVKDHALNLRFTRIIEDPMVSAIVVTRDRACKNADGATPPRSTTSPKITTPPKVTTPRKTTGFPRASNTGVPAGTSLKPSGSITVKKNGAVIDARDVNGSIRVEANDVTIKRTRIRNPGGMAIWIDPNNRGLVIEDVEIDGTGNPDGASAVGYANFTMRRTHIHDFGEGPAANGNVVIEDSYLHDFTNFIRQGAHQDGIQMEWGDNMTIRHNTVLMNVDGANSAIWLSAGNPHSNVVISRNLVAGASYSIGLGNQATATNNRISTRAYPKGGYFGPFTYADGRAKKSGNTFYESGKAA